MTDHEGGKGKHSLVTGQWSVVIAQTMKLVNANTVWSLVSGSHCTNHKVGQCHAVKYVRVYICTHTQ